jgi:hypothetical protein
VFWEWFGASRGATVGGWDGEDLVEATVVGQQVFVDEFGPGEVDLFGAELEVGLDFGVAIEAGALPVGGEAEEDVKELCPVAEVGEDAVREQAEREPCEGFLDGSESVWAR